MRTKTLKTEKVINDDITGQPISKKTPVKGLFTQPSALQLNCQLLARVKATLPDAMEVINLAIGDINKSDSLSNDEKIEIANKFLKLCLDNADKIVELMDNSEVLEQIEELIITDVPGKVEFTANEGFQLSHFLFETVKVLGLGALSTSFPISALLLAASLPSAAQAFNASEVIINSGIPSGGVDLCAGLAHCIQGYIIDLVQNRTYSFSRSFSGSFKQGPLTVDISGVIDCLSNTKIGMTLAQYLEHTIGNASVVCYATQSIPNFQITTTVTGTNITDPLCNGFQQTFDPVLQNCVFPSSSWIVNALAGGVAGLVATITAIAIISAKTRCCTKSCCEEKSP